MSQNIEGFDSPQRAALAKAIARQTEVDADHAARTKALSELAARKTALFIEKEKAEGAIKAAKEAATAHIVASARGNAGKPPESVASVRARFQALEDEYEATVEAIEALEADGRLSNSLGVKHYRDETRRAAAAVLGAGEVPALARGAPFRARARRRTGRAGRRLLVLGHRHSRGRSPAHDRAAPTGRDAGHSARLRSPCRHGHAFDQRGGPARAPSL